MTAKKRANAIEPAAPISRLNALHKASQGWQMRVQGHTWESIARATGYSDGATAYRAVKNYFGSVPKIDHDMQRAVARERTEFLQRKALEQVDVAPSPANIRAAVETLRRAAALDGLDAAMKVAVAAEVGDVTDWANRILGLVGQSLPVEPDIFSDDPALGFGEPDTGEEGEDA